MEGRSRPGFSPGVEGAASRRPEAIPLSPSSKPTHPPTTTAADESVSRRQATALLRSWYLSSPHDSPADGYAERDALAPAPTGPEAEAEADWQDDAAFMEWVQGGGGASRVALELRLLRTRAAARQVTELAGTAEGTEGLVAGLREAVRSNPSLVLQLRSLVAPRS